MLTKTNWLPADIPKIHIFWLLFVIKWIQFEFVIQNKIHIFSSIYRLDKDTCQRNIHLWTLTLQTVKTRHKVDNNTPEFIIRVKWEISRYFLLFKSRTSGTGEIWTMDIGNLHYSLDIDVDKNIPKFIWDMTLQSLVLLCSFIFPVNIFNTC